MTVERLTGGEQVLAAAATIRADRTTKNFIVLADGAGRSVDELLGASTDVWYANVTAFIVVNGRARVVFRRLSR